MTAVLKEVVGKSLLKGFRAVGTRCGLKKGSGSSSSPLDFALLYVDQSVLHRTSSACVFTTNKFCAASVQYSKALFDQIETPVAGVVVNSGCANACTGEEGYSNSVYMSKKAKDICYPEANGSVMVMSTGVIGVQLQKELLDKGFNNVRERVESSENEPVFEFERASEAILTTDTFAKTCEYKFNSGENSFHIAGMAKGSGMIHPNMATMLG